LESISRKQVKPPILALWGDSDGFVPLDDTVRNFASTYDFFTLEVIENAGHCLHDEHPHIVNTKVLQFLSERVGE
jgi:pimeloyl-ACP methyl ester carboxylesterase